MGGVNNVGHDERRWTGNSAAAFARHRRCKAAVLECRGRFLLGMRSLSPPRSVPAHSPWLIAGLRALTAATSAPRLNRRRSQQLYHIAA